MDGINQNLSTIKMSNISRNDRKKVLVTQPTSNRVVLKTFSRLMSNNNEEIETKVKRNVNSKLTTHTKIQMNPHQLRLMSSTGSYPTNSGKVNESLGVDRQRWNSLESNNRSFEEDSMHLDANPNIHTSEGYSTTGEQEIDKNKSRTINIIGNVDVARKVSRPRTVRSCVRYKKGGVFQQVGHDL